MLSKLVKYLKKPSSRSFCLDLSKPKTSSIKGKRNNVYKICITGGPCSGKTTGMNYIKQRFAPEFIVYSVPEIATMTVSAGATIIPSTFTEEEHLRFVENFMRFQMNLEEFFVNIAIEKEKDVILLMDRGVLDGPAYTTETNREILDENEDLSKERLREAYDMVIHMVTAANGAEQFYTLENNSARTETVEVARLIDDSLIKAWTGSQNHLIIDNSGKNFQDKIDRVYNAVAKQIGVSEKLDFTKKYFLEGVFDPECVPESIKHETFKEMIYFLRSGEKRTRSWIKIRIFNNGRKTYYYYHRKLARKEEERIEIINSIDLHNYGMYYRQRDRKRRPVEKEITVFVWNNQNYVVETFKDKKTKKMISILRLSSDTKDNLSKAAFPDFLEIKKDVSEDPRYFTINL